MPLGERVGLAAGRRVGTAKAQQSAQLLDREAELAAPQDEREPCLVIGRVEPVA